MVYIELLSLLASYSINNFDSTVKDNDKFNDTAILAFLLCIEL